MTLLQMSCLAACVRISDGADCLRGYLFPEENVSAGIYSPKNSLAGEVGAREFSKSGVGFPSLNENRGGGLTPIDLVFMSIILSILCNFDHH
jgi:hypothetical protein